MDLSSLTPLGGGGSGQTFLGEVAGERCVVRIYAEPGDRGDAAAEVDAALMRLVRGLLPAPDVLEVRRPDPGLGAPGLLVTSFVEGVRGDALLAGLDEEGRTRAGESFGSVAAVLAGMPLLRPGPFVDGDLTVGAWPDQSDREVPSRCAVVHGELEPRHLLVDPGSLTVRAVTGWGRAHSGDPLTDVTRLLAAGPPGGYRAGVLAGYAARLGGTPDALAERLALP